MGPIVPGIAQVGARIRAPLRAPTPRWLHAYQPVQIVAAVEAPGRPAVMQDSEHPLCLAIFEEPFHHNPGLGELP